MTDTDNTLLLEILKTIQSGIAELKAGQADLRADLLSQRKILHAFQGDMLRQESQLAQLTLHVENLRGVNLHPV